MDFNIVKETEKAIMVNVLVTYKLGTKKSGFIYKDFKKSAWLPKSMLSKDWFVENKLDDVICDVITNVCYGSRIPANFGKRFSAKYL